ncbi:MAG: 1-(5-phosphoribosyl)-5-[(5-phosphoribosylamino)methylideneamino] imidazole-4-carboxamide isomerase [Buchnera aphidicola (Eriosoma harunire)]
MIIPSLDVIRGKIVRLYQGNYENKMNYCNSIEIYLEEYHQSGISIVHIVDLDGAENPLHKQDTLFKKIFSNSSIDIQVGGGIRSLEDINRLISYGAKRVVLGSLAITNKSLVIKCLSMYGPDVIVLAFDVKGLDKKEIFINGWKTNTGLLLEDILNFYIAYGLKYVLCTDIERDGTLTGSSIQLYQDICKRFPNLLFQSSGGIGSIKHIESLQKTGVHDIIIGRGLLDKKFTISEAVKCWQKGLYHV